MRFLREQRENSRTIGRATWTRTTVQYHAMLSSLLCSVKGISVQEPSLFHVDLLTNIARTHARTLCCLDCCAGAVHNTVAVRLGLPQATLRFWTGDPKDLTLTWKHGPDLFAPAATPSVNVPTEGKGGDEDQGEGKGDGEVVEGKGDDREVVEGKEGDGEEKLRAAGEDGEDSEEDGEDEVEDEPVDLDDDGGSRESEDEVESESPPPPPWGQWQLDTAGMAAFREWQQQLATTDGWKSHCERLPGLGGNGLGPVHSGMCEFQCNWAGGSTIQVCTGPQIVPDALAQSVSLSCDPSTAGIAAM